MDLLYEEETDEDGELCRIPRPLVLPRAKNDTIVSPNFAFVCPGKIGSCVLEDEMYMSEIIMMAEDIGLGKSAWFQLPLNEIPTINIFWEYGTCYPLVRYFSPELVSDAASTGDTEETESNGEDTIHFLATKEKLKNYLHAFVLLHPTRFSMILWIASEMDMWTDDNLLQDEDWIPSMVRLSVCDCSHQQAAKERAASQCRYLPMNSACFHAFHHWNKEKKMKIL